MEHPCALRDLISYIAPPAPGLSYISIYWKDKYISEYVVGQPVKNVLRSEKKTFLMNSQYINHNNQSTVETATAISNMFFKQTSEIKHMHTIGVVVVKICVYLLDVLCPGQHNKGHIEPVNEPTRTVLGQA